MMQQARIHNTAVTKTRPVITMDLDPRNRRAIEGQVTEDSVLLSGF